MKYIFILAFAMVLNGLNKSYAQTSGVLDIEARSWDSNKTGTLKFVSHSQREIEHLDSPIVLKNADTITKYIFQKYFFTRSNIAGRNYVSILVGTDLGYIPLIVVDKNFNNSFSDDSVYKFYSSRIFKNEREFYDSLPLIKVDSLNIGLPAENTTIGLKLAPYFQGTKFLNDKETIKSANKYALSFYVTHFLCSKFEINQQPFRLEIIPHPLSFPIYNQHNLAQDGSRWNYIIYKINPDGSEKNVDWGIYQELVDHLKDTSHALKVLNKYFLMNSISLDSNIMSVSIIDSADYLKSKALPVSFISFPEIQAYSLNQKKWTEYDIKINKLTLVEFSGSWCGPCAQILPDLKKLYQKYSGKMGFVSMMEEKSKSDAEKYSIIHKLPWPLFYENIASAESLKAKMKIHVFPSFFLVNQKGEIIYRHSTNENMDELEKQILEETK
jgi:thiol-disulfide isomerase/thioredoxin